MYVRASSMLVCAHLLWINILKVFISIYFAKRNAQFLPLSLSLPECFWETSLYWLFIHIEYSVQWWIYEIFGIYAASHAYRVLVRFLAVLSSNIGELDKIDCINIVKMSGHKKLSESNDIYAHESASSHRSTFLEHPAHMLKMILHCTHVTYE